MQGLPDDIQQRIYFQQDGCPPRNARIVHNYLNSKFGEHWLGTYDPIAWPPRSSNLSPLDFFLWRYLQSIVYAVPIQNMERLKQRIRTAREEMRYDSIVRANLLCRAELCNNKMDFNSNICCEFSRSITQGSSVECNFES